MLFMPKAARNCGGYLARNSFSRAAWLANTGYSEKKKRVRPAMDSDQISTDLRRVRNSWMKMVALMLSAYS